MIGRQDGCDIHNGHSWNGIATKLSKAFGIVKRNCWKPQIIGAESQMGKSKSLSAMAMELI